MNPKEVIPKFDTNAKFTIMIVDDEPNLIAGLKSILKDDFDIITATDGVEALNILKALANPEDISVIISDQRMPNMKGIELFRHLHSKVISDDPKEKNEYRITPETQFILLTGYGDKEVLKNALNETHIFQFISKGDDDLPSTIENTVNCAIEAYISKKNLTLCREVLLEKYDEIESLKKKIEKISEENRELRAKLKKLTDGEEED